MDVYGCSGANRQPNTLLGCEVKPSRDGWMVAFTVHDALSLTIRHLPLAIEDGGWTSNGEW